MTDLLKIAISALPLLLPRREVRYQRGVEWIDDLEVTVGRSIVEYFTDSGVRVRAEVRDYLFKPSLLVFDGLTVEPAEGDLIFDNNEGKEVVYKLLPDALGETWRYSDRYHILIRIHTKEIEEADE